VPVRGDDSPEPSEKAAGAALLDLVAVMDRLRTECPWDARQTHESLVPYLLEETYETLEAIERGDIAELRGELGDVLLQVLFHSRIAAERTDGTAFTIDDVAADIADKLVRRHPHVFADVSVSGADEVKRNWETIKAQERAAAGGGPASALAGVPMSQPALSLAAQLQRRAAAAGAPPELAELQAARSGRAPGSDQAAVAGAGRADGSDGAKGRVSDVGAELFALVARARAAGLDPELELRRAAQAFRDRFQAWEESSFGT
jgi:XTP/dITP diphosphohydrolase